jgi:hypothetical protein
MFNPSVTCFRNKLAVIAFCLLGFTVATAFPGVSKAQIANPDGGLTAVPAHKFWPQTLQGSHFNEFWNYQMYLNDGIKLHIIFSAANFGGLKSPVTGVRITALIPGQNNDKPWQVLREYDINLLVQDTLAYRLQPRAERELYIEGKLPEAHRIRINTSKEGVAYDIDLTFSNINPAFTLGSGRFDVNNERIGILTHIPYAEVQGHVSVSNHRREVYGTAYMDHTYQYQTTTRLLHSGYRFVLHEDADNWDVIYFLLPEDGGEKKTVGYRLYKRNGDIRISSVERITQKTKRRLAGKNLALTMEIELGDGNHLRITRSDDQEVYALLGELNWIARRAARSFLGGEVIDFRGTAHLLEPSQLPKLGEYNFFLVD